MRRVACNAFDEARQSRNILIFAYVIMDDHTHFVTDGTRTIKDALRFLNGISARRVINYLLENRHAESLAKLAVAEQSDGQRYSAYQRHPNAFRITGEETLLQKVNYIHSNPVRAGMVDHPDDYEFSSARLWHRRARVDEPLVTDHALIDWR